MKAIIIFLSLLILPVLAKDAKAQEEGEREWALDLSFQQYFLPSEADLSMPVVGFTYKNILLEARHNYEEKDATSLWLGRPFAFGESWEWELTPMVGGIFDAVEGMAPGLKADVTWKWLNIYSEMEYVFNFEGRENNFFYSWSEVTAGVLDWLRVGIVGNRTRAYSSSVEIDRGPIVAVDLENVTLSCVALNVDTDVTVILGFEIAL